MVLLIDEHILEDGSLRRTYLKVASGDGGRGEGGSGDGGESASALVLDGERPLGRVSAHILGSLMQRYGRPLERDDGPDDSRLDLGQGRSLEHLRFRALVDASSRDYLVWREPGAEALAAMGRQIAAALRFLLERERAR